MFTEEEAEIMAKLGLAMKSVRTIAKAVNRPVEEINPILASLAERMLIIGFTKRKVPLYGLLNFYPGVYEAQMVLSETKMREGDEGAFYKEFARLFKDFWEELFAWMRTKPGFADRYQILGAPLGRIISIEEAIDVSPGLGILSYPTDKFSEMADRAKKSICQIDVCTCRQELHLVDEECSRVDKPTSVTCTLAGTVAEAAIKAGAARRISKEQFIESRMQAGELGLVTMTDDTVDPLLICTCCDCCCSIVEFWVRRYFQLKGREENFLPKLTLGATRALSRINPIHVTGPRARRLMK
jgi:hypothetical protein